MQVVININDGTYEAIKNEYCALPPQKGLKKVLWDAVKDGTPLPKGHGRLIDADAVLEEPIGNTYKDIDIAETIVEADKKQSEE